MINWQPNNLQDDIVALTPLQQANFEELYNVASDPLIWEQHPIQDRYQIEVFRPFFDVALSSNTAFVIIDKASGKIIGSTRYYDYKPESSSIAIGYTFLARAYWGGRYNKAVKRLLLEYAFNQVNKVYFHVGVDNIRSQAAILKLGAVKVAEVGFDHAGEKLPHYEYLLVKPNSHP